MRYIFFVGLLFSFQKSLCQLVELGVNRHHSEPNRGLIYEQFKFRVKRENERYVIKSLTNDSILFDPGRRAYYETFNKQYLISTIIDTQIIEKGTAGLYCYFPRVLSYIIPISSFEKSTVIYSVDFKGKIIMENLDYELPEKIDYFKIREINFEKLKIFICNKSDKKITLDLIVVKR